MFKKDQYLVCMMETTNEGKTVKAHDKSKHIKEMLEKSFPKAVEKSEVQYERVLLKRNAITNIRLWNNTSKTVLHDGWVLMTEKGIFKCTDEKCTSAPESLVDYKNVDEMCRVK